MHSPSSKSVISSFASLANQQVFVTDTQLKELKKQRESAALARANKAARLDLMMERRRNRNDALSVFSEQAVGYPPKTTQAATAVAAMTSIDNVPIVQPPLQTTERVSAVNPPATATNSATGGGGGEGMNHDLIARLKRLGIDTSNMEGGGGEEQEVKKEEEAEERKETEEERARRKKKEKEEEEEEEERRERRRRRRRREEEEEEARRRRKDGTGKGERGGDPDDMSRDAYMQELKWWREKSQTDVNTSVTQLGMCLAVLASFLETGNAAIGGTALLRTQNLAENMQAAIDNGEFNMSLRAAVNTPSALNILKNPITSFTTTFASVLLDTHKLNLDAEKGGGKKKKKKKKTKKNEEEEEEENVQAEENRTGRRRSRRRSRHEENKHDDSKGRSTRRGRRSHERSRKRSRSRRRRRSYSRERRHAYYDRSRSRERRRRRSRTRSRSRTRHLNPYNFGDVLYSSQAPTWSSSLPAQQYPEKVSAESTSKVPDSWTPAPTIVPVPPSATLPSSTSASPSLPIITNSTPPTTSPTLPPLPDLEEVPGENKKQEEVVIDKITKTPRTPFKMSGTTGKNNGTNAMMAAMNGHLAKVTPMLNSIGKAISTQEKLDAEQASLEARRPAPVSSY
jgi:hypothetical protein